MEVEEWKILWRKEEWRNPKLYGGILNGGGGIQNAMEDGGGGIPPPTFLHSSI